MLTIIVPGTDLWDERKEEFVTVKPCKLSLEHSLVSISKWEAKHHKPFLKKDEKSIDETVDYVKCMVITQNVPDDVFYRLTAKNFKEINDYIENPMTATTVRDYRKAGGREIITSELIYYWMFSLNIPLECQKWHLNRLLMLIRVFNAKNDPGKKMSKSEVMSRNAAENARRRAKYNSKG